MKAAAILICALFIASITLAAVKPVGSATINGSVRDESGKPIEKARVQVFNQGVLLREVYTDAFGKYEIKKLPKGKLKITVWSLGFATKSGLLKLREGQEKEVNFVLVAGTTS